MTNDFLFLRINEVVFNINLNFYSPNGTKNNLNLYVFDPCNEKTSVFLQSFLCMPSVPKHTANGSFSAL